MLESNLICDLPLSYEISGSVQPPKGNGLLFVVAAITAVSTLLVATPTFAHQGHPHPTPTATSQPTPTPTILPLVITTTSVPDGNIGTSYDVFLTSQGGQGTPDLWSLVAETLPAGLKIANYYGVQSTIIYGTPTQLQTTTFTVQVKNNAGVATQSFRLTIDPPPHS